MKTNMGNVDKTVRIVVAIVIAVLFFTDRIGGVYAIVAMAIATIFVLTSFVGVCPLYLPFGISTRRKIQAKN